jgi:threonylcarbamoyladenosine tRNA methylthiotransferase MtaB
MATFNERFRDFNLTSDVIVGFPAEDERAFANTLRVVGDAGITKVHVSPYSPHPGTRTAVDAPVGAVVAPVRAAVATEEGILAA